ncbi:DUF6216 family protein [Pseudorhodoferax sp. Leaf267]|uniref:DUF6216 family protein n=1 Tax=Pseudorhodoferax sp. Leaf267 TaxID=1736316 RepID=UPI001F3EED9B|nr:DUF6216 family protein [Pseudorhodoferax sp. Leaf267]
MDLVGRAGRHVDLRGPALRGRPRARWIGAAILAGMLLGLGAVHVVNMLVLQPPLLRVIATDTWYALDGQTARQSDWWHTHGRTHQLSSATCEDRAAVVQRTGYPAYDIKVLCDLLQADRSQAQLKAVLVGQQVVAGLLCIPLVVWGAGLLLWARGAAAARELHKAMAQDAASQRQ